MDNEKIILDSLKSFGSKLDNLIDNVSDFRVDTSGRLSTLETQMKNFEEQIDERTTISSVKIEIAKEIDAHIKNCPHNADKSVFSISPDTRKWITKILLIGGGLGAGVGVQELFKMLGL